MLGMCTERNVMLLLSTRYGYVIQAYWIRFREIKHIILSSDKPRFELSKNCSFLPFNFRNAQ